MIIVPRKRDKRRTRPKIMLHQNGDVYHLPTDTRYHEQIRRALKDQFGAKITNPDTYSTQ